MKDIVNTIEIVVVCTSALVTVGLILSFIWGLISTLSLRGAIYSFKETISPALFIMFVVCYFASLYYCAIDPIFGIIHLLVCMLGLARITPIE